jgi:hypothetical protein
LYITGERTICYNYLIIDTISFSAGVRILQKGNIIHRWKEPEEVTAYSSSIFIQMSKDITPRVLLMVSLILVPVFLVLSNLAPEEIFRPIARHLIWILPVAILLCLLYFVQGLLGRFFETKYTIGEKKIVKTGFNNKVIYWKNVTGYSLGKDEQFPDAISITVYSKRIKTVLWLPKGELSSQVISTFNERCPLITEVEADQPSRTILSDSEYFYLLVLSLIYSIMAAYLVFPYRSARLWKFILLVTIVLGPGTLGCLFFYGWESLKEKAVRAYALIFNMFAFFLSSLCWILLCLYHWSKIIKELGGK